MCGPLNYRCPTCNSFLDTGDEPSPDFPTMQYCETRCAFFKYTNYVVQLACDTCCPKTQTDDSSSIASDESVPEDEAIPDFKTLLATFQANCRSAEQVMFKKTGSEVLLTKSATVPKRMELENHGVEEPFQQEQFMPAAISVA